MLILLELFWAVGLAGGVGRLELRPGGEAGRHPGDGGEPGHVDLEPAHHQGQQTVVRTLENPTCWRCRPAARGSSPPW